MSKEKTHIFDKVANIKRLLNGFYIVCALLLLTDFVYHRHVVHEWENLWGFYGVYGFVACVVLVLVAKQMRKFLMRSERYYDND